MKINYKWPIKICLSLALVCFLVWPSFASDPPKSTSGRILSDVQLPLVIDSGSRIWYEGKSTLHPFSATATEADIYLQIPLPEAQTLTKLFEPTINSLVKGNKVKVLKVTIPVKKLKSGDGGLDSNMYGTLKQKDYANITYQLLSAKFVSYDPKAKTYSLKTTGNLAISGQVKQIEMAVDLRLLDNDLVEITGEKQVLLKDFGISPPTIMFFLKVENEFQVKFKLLLSLAAKPAINEEVAK